MSSLAARIDEELKESMKAKDSVKMETLRMLKAAVKNYLIDKRKEVVEEPELMALIQKQIKQREDSIESFQKASRKDLVDKELREKTILEAYLPPKLSDQELEGIVKKAIQNCGAARKVDMGKVMKEAIALSQGRADGKRINSIASVLLK